MVRTRIAPSPTGIAHIGTARTALFNFLFAKHNKGVFILRIEDTDQARKVMGSEEALYEIFRWLGLLWDEKYVQSERLAIYKKHAGELKEKGVAYEDDGAIRFSMPKSGKTSWTDAIGKKHVVFENNTQEDFIILKSDGFPTYNFANVVDDHLMEITHVIRGDEFISSTPKHIQLYNAFNWELPVFAHLPVILGNNHQKLSKRNGAKSALDYKNEGFLKEALLNYMALLGWSPGENKEIMSIEEMTAVFDLKDINTASPIFDLTKLEWLNGVWIRQISVSDLKKRLLIYYKDNKTITSLLESEQGEVLLPLSQTRIKTLKDFEEFITPDVKYVYTKEEKELAKDLLKAIDEQSVWKSEQILEMAKKFKDRHETSMKTLYILLTGRKQGLPLSQMMEVYGKQYYIDFLKRIIT